MSLMNPPASRAPPFVGRNDEYRWFLGRAVHRLNPHPDPLYCSFLHRGELDPIKSVVSLRVCMILGETVSVCTQTVQPCSAPEKSI